MRRGESIARAGVLLLVGLLALLAGCAAPTEASFREVVELTKAGDIIEMRFQAETREGLSWEVYAEEPLLHIRVGESYRTTYHFKNLADRPVTARLSRRPTTPEGYRDSLKVLGCFCLIHQTLGPGEEVSFPVWVRVAPGTPVGEGFGLNFVMVPIEKYRR